MYRDTEINNLITKTIERFNQLDSLNDTEEYLNLSRALEKLYKIKKRGC